jgi:hypothetical protein
MRDFIHQPLPVSAVQITDENAKDVAQLVNGKLYPANKFTPAVRIYFHCCEGRRKAEWGDWIIRDGRGFTTMTNKEFITTYQEKP